MEEQTDSLKWDTSWREVGHLNPRLKFENDHWATQFPFHTVGRYIRNAFNERVRLRGINWYGASDVTHVVGGLNVQSLDVICQTVHDIGFNVVRLPFSNEMLRRSVPSGAIDFDLNPLLKGLTALEVYDEVVRCLGQHRVAVIINNHTTYGEFCGPPSQNSLWFDPRGTFSEAHWMQDWVMMARRYSLFPHVVGYDLRNEIRPRISGWPQWCGRTDDKLRGSRNWARAARHVADRLLQVNSTALIVVERIVWPQRPLTKYAAVPGPLLPALQGRIVLGVHLYSWSGPGRFVPTWSVPPHLQCLLGVLKSLGIVNRYNYGDMSPDKLERQMFEEWGSVLDAGICPVWVSEFGADTSNEDEMTWFSSFVQICAKKEVDWAYWPLNVGPKPGCGSNEAYGMLSPDWTPNEKGDHRLKLLKKLDLHPPEGVSFSPMSPQRLVPLGPRGKQESVEAFKAVMAGKDPLRAITSRLDLFHMGSQPHRLKRVASAGPTMNQRTDEIFQCQMSRRKNSSMPLIVIPKQ